jgi:hypothetical protein
MIELSIDLAVVVVLYHPLYPHVLTTYLTHNIFRPVCNRNGWREGVVFCLDDLLAERPGRGESSIEKGCQSGRVLPIDRRSLLLSTKKNRVCKKTV